MCKIGTMQIRAAADSDEDRIRELFNACFGHELSHEEWHWKYRESYMGSSAFIAEVDGAIVAHYGGLRMSFYLEGLNLTAWQGCDVMTHPKYRSKLFAKRGVIVRTAEEFFQANPGDYVFGFPSVRHCRLMSLQQKFEPHRFVRVLKKGKNSFCAADDSRPSVLASLKDGRAKTGWGSVTAPQIDRFWGKVRDSAGLTVDKNSDYLFWRFRDHPSRNYEILTLKDLFIGSLRAYAVFRMEKEQLLVLDIQAAGEAQFRCLLSELELLATQRGADAISFWRSPTSDGFRELLLRDGYEEEDGIPYTVRIFEGSRISSGVFFERYNYSMGDYDAA